METARDIATIFKMEERETGIALSFQAWIFLVLQIVCPTVSLRSTLEE